MKISPFIFYLLLFSNALHAQPLPPERERAGHWASKGQNLMRTGQYAEAYTAFQLARGLGAPNMATQMERAKRLNLNSIQFRALTAEARAIASLDPTQSLRLLEYAHQKFPDSTSILKLIGEVANLPDNWYYSLRGNDLLASPRFSYLLAETDKTRLYRQQGDSLTLVHTFPEKSTLRVFSPDEQYVFIGNKRQGSVYGLQGKKLRLIRTLPESITNVRFSPNTNPRYGAWLLTELPNEQTKLYDLLTTTSKPLVFEPPTGAPLLDEYEHACSFSPDGRYLLSPDGFWQFTPKPERMLRWSPEEEPSSVGSAPAFSRFSGDGRHLLVTEFLNNAEMYMDLGYYALTEKGDSLLPMRRGVSTYLPVPRKLWQPFSPDGRYRWDLDTDSLFFFDSKQWLPVLSDEAATKKPLPDSLTTFEGDFRFSPDNRHLLLAHKEPDKPLVFQLWGLKEQHRYLIHEFAEKTGINDDVFSPDGTYLLARHTTTDKLWRIDPTGIRLVHTFGKSFRKPDTFDEHGFPVSSAYFSPSNRYLLTYGATPKTADSLWQLPTNESPKLVPLHGFRNRLKESGTVFSPDERWMLTRSSGNQPAILWNINQQILVQSDQVLSPTEALFSPKGNYLFTNTSNIGWRVTDRRLEPFTLPNAFTSLTSSYFSPDERYLVNERLVAQEADDVNEYVSWTHQMTLFRVNREQLRRVRRYTSTISWKADQSETPHPKVILDTYHSGLFSPDGRLFVSPSGRVPRPVRSNQRNTRSTAPDSQTNALSSSDVLWNLGDDSVSVALPIANLSRLFTRQFMEGNTFVDHWRTNLAGIFSRDGQFLLLKTRTPDRYQFHTLTPKPGLFRSLPTLTGWPIDVSATGDYWLTGTFDYDTGGYYDGREDEDRSQVRQMADMPDTLRLWRRTGTAQQVALKQIAQVEGLYKGLNFNWQVNKPQPLFSPSGNYLLLPTLNPTPTTLFNLVGDKLRPVVQLKSQLLAAAYIPAAPQHGWDVGLIYTDSLNQTHLLRHGAAGSRIVSLGFGLLHDPPRFFGKQAYWIRKTDDVHQLELLDLVTGQTLVQLPFGPILDVAVRPSGDAWVVSTDGARLVRSPTTTLRWLKQTPVAPLNVGLKNTFVFL